MGVSDGAYTMLALVRNDDEEFGKELYDLYDKLEANNIITIDGGPTHVLHTPGAEPCLAIRSMKLYTSTRRRIGAPIDLPNKRKRARREQAKLVEGPHVVETDDG